ncbi:hypothetical protein SASPL_130867 [Salvia splendens]|uniref:J domain-containing protein n=1 Tax=Salvia splendens TaxID=180675 RepID=A0A8X8ZJT8_SALSN|nr:hypothetical protein SASPL_130867 [Salvia splendens]
MAMKWHRTRTQSTLEKRSQIQADYEAYDVLSDSQKRQIYDLYGEEASNRPHAPPSDVCNRDSGGFKFSPRDAEDIFEDFLGSKPATGRGSIHTHQARGKKGTKITFPEKGNHEAGAAPGDLIFIVDEKPHQNEACPISKDQANTETYGSSLTSSSPRDSQLIRNRT